MNADKKTAKKPKNRSQKPKTSENAPNGPKNGPKNAQKAPKNDRKNGRQNGPLKTGPTPKAAKMPNNTNNARIHAQNFPKSAQNAQKNAQKMAQAPEFGEMALLTPADIINNAYFATLIAKTAQNGTETAPLPNPKKNGTRNGPETAHSSAQNCDFAAFFAPKAAISDENAPFSRENCDFSPQKTPQSSVSPDSAVFFAGAGFEATPDPRNLPFPGFH
eukprot:TRINITY_DN285_c0_g2_i2.p1 TRINITY_DN285_c0_g2~~TRINITY_DN285_c0_g2_i2.p1  ORF type:complete len:218 (-),score=33.95 TRINITY_DN285_c0_g2_i2:152-805(-)